MFSDSKIALNYHVFEQFKSWCIRGPTENVNEFLGKFECRTFKFHIFARRPVKNETEINMDQMAALIYENIAVMSVFNLKNETHNSVGSQTPDEVISCCFKFLSRLCSVLLKEIFMEVYFKSLS